MEVLGKVVLWISWWISWLMQSMVVLSVRMLMSHTKKKRVCYGRYSFIQQLTFSISFLINSTQKIIVSLFSIEETMPKERLINSILKPRLQTGFNGSLELCLSLCSRERLKCLQKRTQFNLAYGN